MEEAEVIDIDDLLGSAVPLGQPEAEEYDFENFPYEGDPTPTPESTKEASQRQAPSTVSSQQGGLIQRNAIKPNKPVRHSQPKASLEEEFKRLFLTSKSSKRKVQDQERGLAGVVDNNNVTEGDQHNGSYCDSKVSQHEALVDALIQGELSDVVLSEEELCIDVNSEELRQFILEFEASNEEIPAESPERRRPKQGIITNHRHSQSDDQDSLNSSISTTESRDGSLTSSLASSDIHLSPVRTKQKVPRGKSVRFLMSNLLRNNKAQHHAGRTSGSDDDSRDPKRVITRPKDRNKKKEKEDREKDRIAKQHSKMIKSQQISTSSGKIVTRSASHAQPRRPGALVQDGKTQSKNQSATATIATPLSPEGRDNTLPKQLIQAATRGDLQVLEFLLAANEGLSQVRDNRGNTLLHAVARRGHSDCLAWLASGPCAGLLSVENDDCFTAAALAVKHGQLACVTWLAKHSEAKSELHTQDNRWSLLHLAARFGQEPCLRWLLEHMQTEDISLDQTDHSNNSPAHLAAKYGHLSCLQTLVEFNSDVTLLNKKKQSPFTLATRYHHATCAQFLVVVETCIKLSSELMVTQRQLRESQQEKEALGKKLREAMSCTDALVHMQKTDLSHRIEQVQGEYVDLTNLLVHQLDLMHRHQTESGTRAASTISREDILICRQKAGQLEQACSELLEQDHRHEEDSNNDQLQEIERRLNRLQPLPTSPIWPTPMADPHPGLALDSMRTRLSEVNHQISTLHHLSPSLASDNLDTLSLSSSYASSLSSSSSSLQTGLVHSSPGQSPKKRRVSWTEEPTLQGTAAYEEITPETRTNLAKRNSTTVNNVGSPKPTPPDLSRETQGQRLSQLSATDLENKEYTSVLGVSTRHHKDVIGNSKPSQAKPNVLCVQAEINHQKSPPDFESETSRYSGVQISISHKKRLESSREVRGRNLSSPPSYEESCTRQLRNPHRVEPATSADDTSKRKADPVRNLDQRPVSLDQSDPKSSGIQTNSSVRDISEMLLEPAIPEAYFLPSFDKLPKTSETIHQHYAPQKHGQHSMPDFMRKVQRTNEFGEPEVGEVIIKINNREEMVLLPPGAAESGGELSISHRHLNSNSSMSSVSSDPPWSESDPDESPRPNRQHHRGGILSKKSADGGKKTQEKHIKFALDDAGDKPTTAASSSASGKPHSSKRRDLSPIYEAPDLLKSTKEESKSKNKDTREKKSDKNYANSLKTQSEKLCKSSSQDEKSSVGGRNFCLFSYSSDEGDHEGKGSNKKGNTTSRVKLENLKYPGSLTDVLSQEFNGNSESNNLINGDTDDMQYKLWYETSDDEDEHDDNQQHLQISSGDFERHICYL